MTSEDTSKLLKRRLTEQITKNYDNYFSYWISDPWHAEIPQLYVDVFCSQIGSIREKFPGLLGDLCIKKIESMAEDMCYAIDSLLSVYPDHNLELIIKFTNCMVDRYFEDNEISMLFESSDSESENENPI